jgi:hypothetical protein
MVRHQAVRVDPAVQTRRQFSEMQEVKKVVTVAAEAGSAINAALDNVDRYTGKNETQCARHEGQTDCPSPG